MGKVECGMVGRPPPRPSPTNCVGEGGATHLPEHDRILPSPRGTSGEGPPAGAVRSRRRATKTLRLSRAAGEGAGGRGRRPTQFDPSRRAEIHPNNNLPQVFLGEVGEVY